MEGPQHATPFAATPAGTASTCCWSGKAAGEPTSQGRWLIGEFHWEHEQDINDASALAKLGRGIRQEFIRHYQAKGYTIRGQVHIEGMPMSVFVAPAPKSPATLTYLELRKAVGFIAIGLPFGVALPWLVLGHSLEGSISAYYYTSSRDLFVGSLCAIAMFLLCCRGFDKKDLIAGGIAALFALGVAFFPTKPEDATPTQQAIGHIHVIAATLLFSTLAVFCLWLFKMTAEGVRLTQKKLERNRVYTVCGLIILGSMVAIGACRLFHIQVILGIGPWLIFETTALWAFGFAWLTKGEFILKDETGANEERKGRRTGER